MESCILDVPCGYVLSRSGGSFCASSAQATRPGAGSPGLSSKVIPMNKRTDRILIFLAGSATGAGAYALVAGRPIRSAAMGATNLLFRLRRKGPVTDAEATTRKYQQRDYPAPAPIPGSLRERCGIREEQVQGQPVFTLIPKAGWSAAHIIYTHGGGYVDALRTPHWWIIDRLIEETGATVTVPIYPLAPEHTYRTAYALLEAVYRAVTEATPAARVVLCGDSAGGGLALGQAMHYRDLGLPLPGRVILFSPWVDITGSNPAAAVVETYDPMLALSGMIEIGRWWAGGDDRRSPLLSPLYGDLSGLPPLDVFQGTYDVLLPDARKLKEGVDAAGGEIHLYEYPGAFHVFVGATFTPEAHDAFQKVARSVATVAGGIGQEERPESSQAR